MANDAESRRHYAEIYRKLNDDRFYELARRVGTKAGLTNQEINGAVGPSYWGLSVELFHEQRYWISDCMGRCFDPRPPSGPLPPPPNPVYRMHYAEICRKLVWDNFADEAHELQGIFRLTPREIHGETAGYWFWAAADATLTWADSLLTPPPPPKRRRRR